MHFDEKSMFAGDKKGAKSLKVKLVFWMTSKVPILKLGCVILESPSAFHKYTAESKVLSLSFLELYLRPFNQLYGKVLSWSKQTEISGFVPWVRQQDCGEAPKYYQ